MKKSAPKCPYCAWPLSNIEPGREYAAGEFTMCVNARCGRPLVWRPCMDAVMAAASEGQGFEAAPLRAYKVTANDVVALSQERMVELRAAAKRWRAENDA